MWFKDKEEMEEYLQDKKVLVRREWKIRVRESGKEVQISLVQFQSFDWDYSRTWKTQPAEKMYYYT